MYILSLSLVLSQVSLSIAKNSLCQHFQGGNPPDDQSGTPDRGQCKNLGEKLTVSLLLPPVLVMSVLSTTLLCSGCI